MGTQLHCSTSAVMHKVPSQIYCNFQPSLGCCGRDHSTPWLDAALSHSLNLPSAKVHNKHLGVCHPGRLFLLLCGLLYLQHCHRCKQPNSVFKAKMCYVLKQHPALKAQLVIFTLLSRSSSNKWQCNLKLGAALSQATAVCLHKIRRTVTAVVTMKTMLAACMTAIRPT